MITHIVSDWLFSPCCVEHQDEFIFERVAVAYSRDYNEVGRAQIKFKQSIQFCNCPALELCEPFLGTKMTWFCHVVAHCDQCTEPLHDKSYYLGFEPSED